MFENSLIVSIPSITLPDPEFYAEGNLATWQDRDDNLWVAHIDPETGMFGSLDPETGDFVEGLEIVYDNGPIDTNLAHQNNQEGGTGNGPEWYSPSILSPMSFHSNFLNISSKHAVNNLPKIDTRKDTEKDAKKAPEAQEDPTNDGEDTQAGSEAAPAGAAVQAPAGETAETP